MCARSVPFVRNEERDSSGVIGVTGTTCVKVVGKRFSGDDW